MSKSKKIITEWSQVPIVVDLPWVCMILGITPDTALKKCKSGAIKAVKVGREWRVTKRELRRILGEEDTINETD